MTTNDPPCLSGQAWMSKPPKTTPSSPVTQFEWLADFRLLLYLFIGFRLLMGVVYQPYTFERYKQDGSPTVIERGMSTFGDLRYYYYFARQSVEGDLPYRDYWYEFPPVSIGLFAGVYGIGQLRGQFSYASWATLIGFIMLAFDVGNLVLLRRLARRLHGEAAAVALPWFYALLAAPAIFPWWTFETLVVFLMLLSLVWLLEGRDRRSALVTAAGILTKYTPILLLPTIWRFYDRKLALRYTLIVLLIVALVFALLIAWGGRMAVASLLAQFNKASYQSVWALLDDNLRTGRFSPTDTRLDPDTSFKPYGNAPVIPAWLRLIPFAAAGLFIFTRRLRQDDRGIVAFFSVTIILFFLWTQGWSPQWALTLTPLILLNFPDRNGVLLCLVIGFAGFIEYPAMFMRTAETEGEITTALLPTYVTIILMRTAVLIGLVIALYRLLIQEVGHERA
ncbi:MAG: hypothetical protein HY866_19705 [Chloroflexi bacterium]|nr:hypothetical protein [Chloroflexota bacterium]